MKAVIFAYNVIGCIGFEAVQKSGIEILALVTHKDDPNEKIYFDSVAAKAATLGIKIFTPDNPNEPGFIEMIKQLAPDVIFSFYYRKMISSEVLRIVNGNAYNLHGSLLPKYRGKCPINWALINGEKETGITLHKMTEKPDAGDIVGQFKISILPEDDAKTLVPKMAKAAAELLSKTLPLIKNGGVKGIVQNEKDATYFGGRHPEDGLIRWDDSAEKINNLVRAVADPFPGAFTFFGQEKLIIWKSSFTTKSNTKSSPGVVVNVRPFEIACGNGVLRVITAQIGKGSIVSGEQVAAEAGIVKDCLLGRPHFTLKPAPTKVLILGVNGFIGSALTERLLKEGGYEVYGLDLSKEKLGDSIKHPKFTFCEGDIAIQRDWIEYHVRKCDIVLPLVAIATPGTYVKEPLRVFELDFEENLRVVRYCEKYKKRIIFPSTSEVYGMCSDEYFNEDSSPLVTGPIRKVRWIYSCSKQLLDRVIWAYGQERGLNFTLFRPFNWIGPKLDSLDSARLGSSRVLTQFALNMVEGTPIRLVDGGDQKRCFTDLSDGIEGLVRIIENKENKANGKIFNIGNPENEASIRELAHIMIEILEKHPKRKRFPTTPKILDISSKEYYGKGYQDVVHRRPSIENAKKYLGWTPKVGLKDAIANALNFFLEEHLYSLKE